MLKPLAIAAACLLAALATGCGESAPQGKPRESAPQGKPERLTLLTKGKGIVTDDVGARGSSPGDRRTFSLAVVPEGSDRPAGRIEGTSTIVDQRVVRGERREFRTGDVQYTLRDGTIVIGGMYVARPGRAAPIGGGVRRPIIGGTGRYRGARGQVTQTPLPDDQIKSVIEVWASPKSRAPRRGRR